MSDQSADARPASRGRARSRSFNPNGGRVMNTPAAKTAPSTPVAKTARDLAISRKAPLATRTDLNAAATKDIAAAMNAILADVFALYVKTKNFHWHMSGPHFRDYHLLLDEQADQLFAMTDPIAERVRKIGGATLRSI